MQGIMLNVLFFAVNRMLDTLLVEAIKKLVLAYVNITTLTGPQKKAAVEEALENLNGALKIVYENTSSSLINLAIESAVVWAKSKTK